MAQKKGGGSTRNGRDSQPKMLGVKAYGGQTVSAGSIIVRRRGTRFRPRGTGALAQDFTLFARIDASINVTVMGPLSTHTVCNHPPHDAAHPT